MSDVLAQNFSPYYNDYDRSKEFLQILFKPGSRVQARELTQLQSILQNQLSILAEYLLEDGNVVEGMGVDIFTDHVYKIDSLNLGIGVDIENLEPGNYITSTGANVEIFEKNVDNFYIYVDSDSLGFGDTIETNIGEIRISTSPNNFKGEAFRVCVGSGIYYVANRFVNVDNGCIYPVSEDTSITGKVGLIYTERFINAKEDSTLNDPAKGTYGYSGEGADRLVISNELVYFSDGEEIPENFLPVACFENGVWEIVVNTAFMDGPDYTQINLELVGGEWVLNVEGNTNAGPYRINLCDLPDFSGEFSEIINSGNYGTVCVDGSGVKIPLSLMIPSSYDVHCSGSDPVIAEGEYWLDTSSEPYILRMKTNNGWIDVPAESFNILSRLVCISTNEVFTILDGEFVSGTNDIDICSIRELPNELIDTIDGDTEIAICIDGETYKTKLSNISSSSNSVTFGSQSADFGDIRKETIELNGEHVEETFTFPEGSWFISMVWLTDGSNNDGSTRVSSCVGPDIYCWNNGVSGNAYGGDTITFKNGGAIGPSGDIVTGIGHIVYYPIV